MPTIEILIGPPASGKSTYRKEKVNQGWSYVNNDELRLEHPDWKERDILEYAETMVKAYMSIGLNVIIDNTNLNPRTVSMWENLAHQHGYDVVKVPFFDVPFWDAVARDEQRDHSVGRSVIYRMYVDAGMFGPNCDFGELYIRPYQNELSHHAIIVDIDGTLADIQHRRHHVVRDDGRKKDWKSFFAGIADDQINDHVLETLNMYRNAGYTIILCSGRGEQYRKETEAWLKANDIEYFVLLMRGFNDNREDSIVKEELYHKYIEPFFDVRICLDDRDRVVNMWRRLGLTVYQVAEGDF